MSDNKRLLFGFFHSPFVAIVAHTLKESGIEFEFVRTSPYRHQNHTPEHQHRNPMLKVPAFSDDDGFNLYESATICRYLSEKYFEQAGRLAGRDKDLQFRYQVDAATEVANVFLQGPIFLWIVYGFYCSHPAVFNWSEVNYELGGCRASMETNMLWTLGRIESGYFKEENSPLVLGGDSIYLVDIVLFNAINTIHLFSDILKQDNIPKFDPFAAFPKVRRHYEFMKASKSGQYILEQQAACHEETLEELLKLWGPTIQQVLVSSKESFKSFLSTKTQ